LIQGTTTLGDVETTGGSSQTIVVTQNGTTTVGDHGPAQPAFPVISRGPGTTPNFNSFTNTTGGHFHTASATPASVPSAITPMGRFMTLITNSSQVDNIPLNCVVFSNSRPAFFTRKIFPTNSVGLYVGTSTFSRAKAADTFPFPISWSNSGNHIHTTISQGGAGGGASQTGLYAYNTNVVGDHSHPTSPNFLVFYEQFKHLLPFMASVNKPVKSGMIVMFKGSSIPSGWKICDGTNGTPNMNGFFLGYDNNENGHDIVKSNKRIDRSPAGYPLPTTPPSSPTNYEVLANFSTPTVSWPHGHALPNFPLSSDFSTNARHFPTNVPHFHSFPSPSIVFPLNFTPNFIKLAFIQKE
jgi:hypothetical protein